MKMKYTSRQAYNDKGGVKGVHIVEAVVEFTGNQWKVVEVLSESGRPSWNPDPMTMSGGVAPHFMNNAKMLSVVGFSPL